MVLSVLKAFLTRSLEEKVYILECNHKRLVKKIEEDKWVFDSNDKVIQCSSLLTDYMKQKIENDLQLSEFELKLLDKIINDGFRSISFFLESDLEMQSSNVKVILAEKLISEGFELIKTIGYFSTKKIPYVEI